MDISDCQFSLIWARMINHAANTNRSGTRHVSFYVFNLKNSTNMVLISELSLVTYALVFLQRETQLSTIAKLCNLEKNIQSEAYMQGLRPHPSDTLMVFSISYYLYRGTEQFCRLRSDERTFFPNTGVNQGPHRPCNLTFDEKKAQVCTSWSSYLIFLLFYSLETLFHMTLQMTLWSMAKSPLMYGGDLRRLDNSTLSIVTNPTLLKINHYSKNNMEVPAFQYSYYNNLQEYVANKLTC